MEPDAQNANYFSTKRDNCATTPKSEHHHSLQQIMERQPYACMFCIRLLKNKTSRHRRRPRDTTTQREEGTPPSKDVGLMIIIRNLSQQQKDCSNKKETGIAPHPKRERQDKKGREDRHTKKRRGKQTNRRRGPDAYNSDSFSTTKVGGNTATRRKEDRSK